MKRFYFAALGFVLLLILPVVLWFSAPARSIHVAIIDKTVPSQSFREHLGITWVLNHFKYTRAGGERYRPADDYFGYVPGDRGKQHHIRKPPADYSDADVIYVADTYGVYEADLSWMAGEREGSRSHRIYGGLDEEEWAAIFQRLQQKKPVLFIAEYNTFASPTSETVRNRVLNYLGIEWSGWTGRYFDELDPDKNAEIPQWIVDKYREEWTYSGAGFVLVNDFDDQVVVLEKDNHFNQDGIRVAFTEAGAERFNLKQSPNYNYWFDMITPREGTTVLAQYKWDLTEQGKQYLSRQGIPTEIAAVVSSSYGQAENYYFAGDYNDVANVPMFYQIRGLDHALRLTQTFSDNAFFWKTYVPMMKSILKAFEQKKMTAPPIAADDPDALNYSSRVRHDRFEIYKDGQWTPVTIKGVNLGMGKPNHFPGEAAITEDEYYRWFEYIGAMNANAVRVYTLHPPGLYNALQRYNARHDNKIYLFHGVWINEERLAETLDAYDPEVLAEFQAEMKRIVDVVHGNADIKPVPGHASGVYRADISEYVIGWILGIEWYPYMVEHTNAKYAGNGEYDGQYFYTRGARPFEVWLAEQMDEIMTYESSKYRAIRPISFTNWVTTDLLEHPAEPLENEDLVSVDPNVIYTKRDMDLTGQFASYHIYPYYPDFLNYEPSYLTYVDHRGEYNNYAAYLAELHAAHRLPILVAEFGVPASRGLTHVNPFGWNQGFLSEREQGMIVSRLFEDIMHEQLMGGLIFTWQDEWFKRTWNTMDYDNPDRRPYWSNAQTNEQQFGILSFDRHKIRVDGRTDDWETAPVYEDAEGALRAMYVDHDERYLYIRLDVEPGGEGYPIVLLDVVPDQGNPFIQGMDAPQFANGVDFIIRLDEEDARVLIDPYYDFFTYQYGHVLQMLKPLPPDPEKGSGAFTAIQYALNKELYIPDSGVHVPFSAYETGRLRLGNGNPSADDYDSLADFYIHEDGIVELRIPWLLIQAKDPSQKEFIGDLYANGMAASRFVDGIHIGALYVNEDEAVTDAFPAWKGTRLEPFHMYTWDNWEEALYEERLKQSYWIVRELFGRYE